MSGTSDNSNGFTLNLDDGFGTFADRVKLERKVRLENAAKIIPFGVSYLDDALSGIFPNDLIVLGAKTGLGKTQMTMLIAHSAAKLGKRVHYLALEAEHGEIERRMKYQLIADRYYRMDTRGRFHLNYADWYTAKLDSELREIEAEIESIEQYLPTLKTYYRTGSFTVRDFERIFFAIKDETDLVIVDHLHYFDLDDENENRAVKQVVMKIRDCVLLTGKPVILISHTRKQDKRFATLIPQIEDFHGSSDIGKIATKAIAFGPGPITKDDKLRPTYIQGLKYRVDGARIRYTGMLNFSPASQRYDEKYVLGIVNREQEFEPLEAWQIPHWAVSAARSA